MKDHVSFKTAELLKKKGFGKKFDEFCPYSYSTFLPNSPWFGRTDLRKGSMKYQIYAPTIQRAMRWLREVHNIDIDIDAEVGMLGVKAYVPYISKYKPREDDKSKLRQIKRGMCFKDDNSLIPASQEFVSYEEAAEEAIKYCLENLI